MMRSIVVDVRKAVVAGLTETLGRPDVAVSYGWLGASDDRRREQIFTNRPRATHEPASLKAGRNHRNERMDFDLVYVADDPTATAEELDEHAMAVAEVVEEFLADHKSNELGVPGLNWLVVSRFELANAVLPTGVQTELTWTLTYDARLT